MRLPLRLSPTTHPRPKNYWSLGLYSVCWGLPPLPLSSDGTSLVAARWLSLLQGASASQEQLYNRTAPPAFTRDKIVTTKRENSSSTSSVSPSSSSWTCSAIYSYSGERLSILIIASFRTLIVVLWVESFLLPATLFPPAAVVLYFSILLGKRVPG